MNKDMLQSLLKLPLRQRVSLAGEMWDSLSDEDIPTPPALRRKLRARLAAYHANPTDVMTLDEFREKSGRLVKSAKGKQRRSA
jgi:putative addiction module component (TIGR02574 family)